MLTTETPSYSSGPHSKTEKLTTHNPRWAIGSVVQIEFWRENAPMIQVEKFEGVVLEDLNLCVLLATDLSGADLRGARMATCDMDGATPVALVPETFILLEGAIFDDNTTWPPGLDPIAFGAVRHEKV